VEVGNAGSGCSHPQGRAAEPAASCTGGYRRLQAILVLQLQKKNAFACRYQVFCYFSLQKLILKHQTGRIPNQTARLELESMCLRACASVARQTVAQQVRSSRRAPRAFHAAVAVQKGTGASFVVLS